MMFNKNYRYKRLQIFIIYTGKNMKDESQAMTIKALNYANDYF